MWCRIQPCNKLGLSHFSMTTSMPHSSITWRTWIRLHFIFSPIFMIPFMLACFCFDVLKVSSDLCMWMSSHGASTTGTMFTYLLSCKRERSPKASLHTLSGESSSVKVNRDKSSNACACSESISSPCCLSDVLARALNGWYHNKPFGLEDAYPFAKLKLMYRTGWNAAWPFLILSLLPLPHLPLAAFILCIDGRFRDQQLNHTSQCLFFLKNS